MNKSNTATAINPSEAGHNRTIYYQWASLANTSPLPAKHLCVGLDINDLSLAEGEKHKFPHLLSAFFTDVIMWDSLLKDCHPTSSTRMFASAVAYFFTNKQ